MAKKKSVTYCSLEPTFPEKAYILFLLIMHEDDVAGLVPLDAIYKSVDAAAEAVESVLQQVSDTNHITVAEECLMMPITFLNKYPMKSGYWNKPTFSYDQQQRVWTFTNVAHFPELHSLLVTPYVYDDPSDTWYFSATLPLLRHDNTEIIEQFMYNSDQVVEPRANSSAIYTIGEKIRFNWRTGETKKIKDSTEKMLGKMN